jgi:cell wall assembly regulator SMI1
MAIVWEPYLDIAPNASEEDIAQVEQVFGVRFPADYRAALREHQGQGPAPSAFNVGRGNDVFMVLLPATRRAGDNQYHLLEDYETMRDYIPEGVVPIAETPGGNRICLDYRADADAPTIVHWDHEQDEDRAIRPIAPSFTALLDALFE